MYKLAFQKSLVAWLISHDPNIREHENVMGLLDEKIKIMENELTINLIQNEKKNENKI